MNQAQTPPSSVLPTHDAPETILVEEQRVSCDGGGGALGHPIVFYDMGSEGWVDCQYCDRRYILKGGPADRS